MNDRKHNEHTPADEAPVAESAATPLQDLEFYRRLRELVRSEFLWKWTDGESDTESLTKAIDHNIRSSGGFRLVGEIELEDDCFDLRLWMEAPLAYTLGDVDVILLEALALDLGRGTIFVRELTRTGLVYHILSYGEGRARELRVNVVGPRMQQIRDLGTLTVTAASTFSA